MSNTELMKQAWQQIAEARDKYVVPKEVEIEPLNRQKEMVMCSLLIETMEENGATRDELMNALLYCGIVLDTDKFHLDWRKAYDDYGIDALCEKYVTPNMINKEIGNAQN
ncbi:MAG: hypothetical protein J6Y02_05465 [Pseudobutyrivibrio sp.]|nr:hypothetical protein [Pseudobutyrivibrio sp.]